MNRTLVWRVAIWLAAIAIAAQVIWFPNFWKAILIPAAVFLVLQELAIGSHKSKVKIFNFLDYIYYILIGLVVVLGSRYVLQAGQATYLDALIEKSNALRETGQLQQRLAQIAVELPLRQSELRDSKRSIASADPKLVANCQTEAFARRIAETLHESITQERLRAQHPIDPLCSGYFANLDTGMRLAVKVESLEQERSRSNARLEELDSKSKTSIVPPTVDELDPEHLKLQFIIFPMMFFVGIAIKVGKTTCSLWPDSR